MNRIVQFATNRRGTSCVILGGVLALGVGSTFFAQFTPDQDQPVRYETWCESPESKAQFYLMEPVYRVGEGVIPPVVAAPEPDLIIEPPPAVDAAEIPARKETP